MKICKFLLDLVTMTVPYSFLIILISLQPVVFGIGIVPKTIKQHHLNINTTGCLSHQFHCDSKCYEKNQYCNGILDCEDGSDEPEGCIPVPQDVYCLKGHFVCKTSLRCIPIGWHCDGEIDCGPTQSGIDDSDEQNCPKNVSCPWNYEKCGSFSNECRPLSSFCDGVRDCPNDADELDYCNNTTLCDNAHCIHGCKPTFDGPKCYCSDGYRPGDDGTSCVDANECELENTCDQICVNTVGLYQCSCVSGYKMENGSCIGLNVPLEESTSILFSTVNSIQRITPDGKDWSNTSKLNLLNSRALEFSHRNRTFYYIHHNMTELTFTAVNIDNFTERWSLSKPIIFNNLDTIQQFALDWLTGNWYFLDDEKEIILLCNNTLKWCKIIIDINLDKGRSLALNPMIGFMYFSKWGMSAPVIERCKMDGTEREVLVDRKIVYPSGVVVDYATNDVYWLDTYLDVIEKVNFDGKNRNTVVKGSTVQNLHGISIFENVLYLTSWKDNSILKINKKTLAKEIIKTNISKPFDLKVFHRQRQPDVAHPCRQNNGNCSHICVSNWNNGIAIPKCLCSMGYTLNKKTGKCTLKSASISLIIARTRPPLIQAIEIENGTETIIPIAGIRPTALEVNVKQKTIYYTEGTGASIYSISLNGTDKKEILSNGADKCVSLAYDWMGNNLYWADRIGSMGNIGVVKLSDVTKKRIIISEYKIFPVDIVLNPKKGIMYWIGDDATNGTGTIYSSWMDGTHKEIFIETSNDPPSHLAIDLIRNRLYWCSPLNRIESINFNKSDRRIIVYSLDTALTLGFYKRNLFYTENNVLISLNVDTNETKTLLEVSPFIVEMKIYNIKGQTGSNQCSNNTSDCKEICLTIPESINCACADGFHLIDSTCIKSINLTCIENQFQCKSNGRCIPSTFTCNQIKDCEDGSDESAEIGGPCGLKLCADDEISCNNNTYCVGSRLICDGDMDCELGEDEEPSRCLRSCTDDEFRCAITKRCIPNAWVCDNFDDCGSVGLEIKDDSDENDCG